MALHLPESMNECIYFTRRQLGEKGKAVAWVFKEKCSQCGKAQMGKPRGPDGKVKIRAKEYICPECKYTVEKGAYEDTLTANIQYTCQYYGHEGEHQMSFKRKKVKMFDEEKQKDVTVDALKFLCEKCKKDLFITKKMK